MSLSINADAGNRLFQASSPQPDDVSAELRFMRHDINLKNYLCKV